MTGLELGRCGDQGAALRGAQAGEGQQYGATNVTPPLPPGPCSEPVGPPRELRQTAGRGSARAASREDGGARRTASVLSLWTPRGQCRGGARWTAVG